MKKHRGSLLFFLGALIIIFLVAFYLYGCAAPQEPTTLVMVTDLEEETDIEVIDCTGEITENPYGAEAVPEAGSVADAPPEPDRWLGLSLPADWTLGFQPDGDSFLAFGPGGCFVRARMSPSGARMIWSMVYDIPTAAGLVQRTPYGYDPTVRPAPEVLRAEAVEDMPCDGCPLTVTVSVNWPVEESAIAALESRIRQVDRLMRSRLAAENPDGDADVE